jgi:hypothetical protein
MKYWAEEKLRREAEEIEWQRQQENTAESPWFVDPSTIRHSAASAVNDICGALGLSPLLASNATKLSKDRRSTVATNKIVKVNEALAYQLSTSLEVDIDPSTHHCQDCNRLVQELVNKFKESTSFLERKRLLTLVPESFKIKDIMNKFNCTSYLVRESSKLKLNYGILPTVKKNKAGNEISPEDKTFVVSFYEENAKMCAGSREYVNKVDPNGAKI